MPRAGTPLWVEELLEFLVLTETEYPCDELRGSEFCENCKRYHPAKECWKNLGIERVKADRDMRKAYRDMYMQEQ